MQYENLNRLLNSSSGTRKHFVSLPVDMQLKLHKLNDLIHSAAELRKYEQLLSKEGSSVVFSDDIGII